MTLPSRSEVEQTLASFEGCTPGPWIVDGDALTWTPENGYGSNWVEIGDWLWQPGPPLTGHDTAVQLADASLIAAAPQLVEWVRELSAEVERLGGTWRCFHCGEVFTTPEPAQEHFGKSLNCETACAIDAAEYRAMEDRMLRYNDEDSDLHREIYRLRSKHVQDKIAAQSERIAALEMDAARYQVVRRLTPQAFHALWSRSMAANATFDGEVDVARLDASCGIERIEPESPLDGASHE